MGSRKQVENGKGWEYSLLRGLEDRLNKEGIEYQTFADKNYDTVRKHHTDCDKSITDDQYDAASEAVGKLIQLEPKLVDNMGVIQFKLQEDVAGGSGDTRDLLITQDRSDDTQWEIGVSAKHNSISDKSPRISERSHVASWFSKGSDMNIQPSAEYLAATHEVWNYLDSEKKAGKILFEDVANKIDRVYKPLAEAIKNEIERIIATPSTTEAFSKYFLGCKDEYQIHKKNDGMLEIRCFNLYGTLGEKSATTSPSIKPKKLKMPSQIRDIRPIGSHKVEISFDNGWQLEMRIHNKSSRIQKSLGVEMTITGQPKDMTVLSYSYK